MFQKIGGAAYNKGLDKTMQLLKIAGNPHKNFKTIHIAGTNGKGSTSSMLAAVLQSAGYKTGLYTSPHLKSFTERIRINGIEIPQDFIVDFVEKYRSEVEDIQPSFFELTVLMAFEYFSNEEVDVAVIEVGMGGRLDSTNVIDPLLSIITNISYDHQAYLGNTLEEIAFEKAGIIKKGVPVIVSELQEEIKHVFEEIAGKLNSSLVFASQIYEVKKEATSNFTILKNKGSYLKALEPQLLGDYQAKNIPAVIAAIESLRSNFDIPSEAVVKGINNVCTLTGLKGRWQILAKDPTIICDTGHNEAGITMVLNQLKSYTYNKLHIVVGMVQDKDYHKVLSLLPKDAQYYFCQPTLPRALEASILREEALKHQLTGDSFPDVNKALNQAISTAESNDLIFVGGSTFVVADLDIL